jgi:non-ribosomal peptide synthetase component F
VREPFGSQGARTPHAVAVLGEAGRSVTYRELHDIAHQLAHHLLGAVPRGVAHVVANLAAMRAGAT